MELISPPTEFYLSYVPGRGYGNHQKIHAAIGHAKNAVGASAYGARRVREEIDGIQTGRYKYEGRVRGGQIWHWTQDHWELLFDIPAGAWEREVPWRKGDWDAYLP